MKRIAIAVLMVLAVAGCGRKADNDNGAEVELSQPIDYTPQEKAALLATFPAPFNAADLEDGEKQFNKCRGCHTITPEKQDLTGPHLFGVF
ncbi:MAG: cytochrome c family protein, partial [Asticcacaulis sp.]|nr:cytochrome c family protein [Asticcacaulis sp.]